MKHAAISSLLTCLLGAWGLLAMSEGAWAQVPPSGPPQPDLSEVEIVVDVEVEGLRRVDRDAALQGVRTRAGAPFDPVTITEDLRTLWRTGFFRDVRVYKERTTGGVRIVFAVVEKPSIREVRIEGNDDLSNDDIKGVIDVRPYTILNVELLKRNLVKVKDLYVEKGYFLAEVDYQILPVAGSEQEVDVVFSIDENDKVMVKQIAFVGNENIPSSDIKGVLQTREGDELSFITQSGTYKQEFFQTDLFRIQALYLDRGYVTVKVGEPTATISRDRRYIYLSVPIEEGEVYNIGKIDFSGEVELKNEEGEVVVNEEILRQRTTVEPGSTFNRTELFQDIQALTDAYRDQGYAYANVTPNSVLHEKERTVDLDLQVERGDIVYIGRIEVTGNTKTRDKVIRREMRINEGDKFSSTRIKLSEARIFQLGYFETVTITNSRGSDPNLMNLTVEIKEKSTGTFQIGAGFSSIENFIATAQIAQNNFLGNGQLLSITATLSFGQFGRQLATLQFFEPYFLDTEFSLGVNGYITRRLFPDFERAANGGSFNLGYPITHALRVSLGYTFEQVAIDASTISGLAIDADQDRFNSTINGTISYDTRNNRLFPSKGMFHVLSSSLTWDPVGDPTPFGRTELNLRFYYPLPLSLVFKTNLQLGWVFGGGDKGVPLSERYYPGGIYSVRGFTPRALGPALRALRTGDPISASQQFIYGGNKQVVLNTELEFNIIEMAGIKGVIFVDMGNAYDDDQNFFYIDTPQASRPDAFLFDSRTPMAGGPPLGLYYSFGFGFRWFSPIGPLRFEWGIPITKLSPDDQGILFEFTIGNFF